MTIVRRGPRVSAEGECVMNTKKLRLGVNIDHVATVRNARGGTVPDPVRADYPHSGL